MIIRLLLFLLIANFLPPLVSLITRRHPGRPLDFGYLCPDGYRLFGPNKTLRGAASTLIGCAFLGPFLLQTSWQSGALAGLLVMSGDLLSSFIKRRLSCPSGTQIRILDQIFEGLFPLLYLAPTLEIGFPDTVITLALFILIAIVGAQIWRFLQARPSLIHAPHIVRSPVRLREWRANHLPLARWQLLFNFEYIRLPYILTDMFVSLAGTQTRGKENALNVRVEPRELFFSDLPKSFDGFRILLLTDLHIDGLNGLTDLLISRVSRYPVDLCLLGGDYRMRMFGPIAPSIRNIRALIPHIQTLHGVYGVLGNHDCIDMIAELEEAGVQMLVNDAISIDRNGERIWVAGVDDPHYYRVHDSGRAFKNVPGDGFKIFLAHSPEAYKDAVRFRPKLYLCGHTHGGQICLPGGKPLFTNCRAPRSMAAGMWSHQGMQGYTSRGVGVSGVPLRFNCPGEISLLTLRCSE